MTPPRIAHGSTATIIPTAFARDGDTLVLHGHPKAGFVQRAARGEALCVAVTHVDGLVMARSSFHSSMNYR